MEVTFKVNGKLNESYALSLDILPSIGDIINFKEVINDYDISQKYRTNFFKVSSREFLAYINGSHPYESTVIFLEPIMR